MAVLCLKADVATSRKSISDKLQKLLFTKSSILLSRTSCRILLETKSEGPIANIC